MSSKNDLDNFFFTYRHELNSDVTIVRQIKNNAAQCDLRNLLKF